MFEVKIKRAKLDITGGYATSNIIESAINKALGK